MMRILGIFCLFINFAFGAAEDGVELKVKVRTAHSSEPSPQEIYEQIQKLRQETKESEENIKEILRQNFELKELLALLAAHLTETDDEQKKLQAEVIGKLLTQDSMLKQIDKNTTPKPAYVTMALKALRRAGAIGIGAVAGLEIYEVSTSISTALSSVFVVTVIPPAAPMVLGVFIGGTLTFLAYR